jgi:hypothetical protein
MSVVDVHLYLQLCLDGNQSTDEFGVERDAIHRIKPDSKVLQQRNHTFGCTSIIPRFDKSVFHVDHCDIEKGHLCGWPFVLMLRLSK